MEEIWKDIEGFKNYKISNLGNVKRIKSVVKYTNGNLCTHKSRILKQENLKGNYKRVTLSKNNKQKRFAVHRLVAIHFINNKEKKPCVNHIDGDPLNNNVSNLEWCTYSENERHSYDVLKKINANRKLKKEDVCFIKNNYVFGRNNSNIKMLSNKYNVDVKTIYNVINEKYYA